MLHVGIISEDEIAAEYGERRISLKAISIALSKARVETQRRWWKCGKMRDRVKREAGNGKS